MKVIIDKGGNYYAEHGGLGIHPGDVIEVRTEGGEVLMHVTAGHNDAPTCRGCCLDVGHGCYGTGCYENRFIFKNVIDIMEDI